MFDDLTNMNEIRKMKDESKGKINDEFVVVLKSKMYSIKDVGGEEKKAGKEVNSVFVKNIKHKEYLNVLFNEKVVRHVMKVNCIKLELMMFLRFYALF